MLGISYFYCMDVIFCCFNSKYSKYFNNIFLIFLLPVLQCTACQEGPFQHSRTTSPLIVWCRPPTWWNSTFGPTPAWCTLRQVLWGTKYWRYATWRGKAYSQVLVAKDEGRQTEPRDHREIGDKGMQPFIPSQLCFWVLVGPEHGLNMESLSLWSLFCLLLLLLTTVLMSQSERYSPKQPSMHWNALFVFLPSSFAFWHRLLHLWKDRFRGILLLHM